MTDWARIAKFAGMLGSAGDGEVVAAARMIERALKAEGLTMGDLVNRIRGGNGFDPLGAARTRAERTQESRRQDAAWEARMAEEEEKARQRSARGRREGREW